VWWTIKERLPISFVVPAYNCQTTIQETLESITSSNLQELDEIIIVDDSSTDDTPRILDRLQKQHASVKLVSHRHNRGTAAAARNTGIEAASHHLIFCLDSDNLLLGSSIRPLVRRLFTSGAEAAAFGEIHYFQRDPAEITHKWVFPEEVTLAGALAGVVWPGPSGNYLFTRRSWLRAGRYHEPYLENRSLDSWMFAIRQLGTGTHFVTLPGTWYCHRYGHESHYVQNWQRGNQSLVGLIGLIPLLELLEEEDVEYLFSKEGRTGWYDHLKEHPIRVKGHQSGESGVVENIKMPLDWRARQYAASVIEKVARRLRAQSK
jgi:glycosyltransferase involved in cell wall biosynthesis